mmetsp:Transcript_18338/g.36963  ORF Transcript_18338/g.36963 Transcript_18338/m.36963 type:complete len:210 (+) Transcript_18338:343-972(+)
MPSIGSEVASEYDIAPIHCHVPFAMTFELPRFGVSSTLTSVRAHSLRICTLHALILYIFDDRFVLFCFFLVGCNLGCGDKSSSVDLSSIIDDSRPFFSYITAGNDIGLVIGLRSLGFIGVIIVAIVVLYFFIACIISFELIRGFLSRNNVWFVLASIGCIIARSARVIANTCSCRTIRPKGSIVSLQQLKQVFCSSFHVTRCILVLLLS